MIIKARGFKIVARFPLNSENLRLFKQLPGAHTWEGNQVVIEPSGPNVDFLRKHCADAQWDDDALKFGTMIDAVRATAIPAAYPSNSDYAYKTVPFAHQEKVFRQSREKEAFALLMEQGTGKTKVTLDTVAWLYAQGKITGLLIIAKNGVHRNWVDQEIPRHLPDWCNATSAFWRSNRGEKSIAELYKRREKPGLVIMSINIEALSTAKGYKACEHFLLAFPSLAAVDESTCIKTPGAKRTKAVLKLSRFAPFRRILTGTPITRGPLDAYSQFAFLDEEILGTSSFYSFKARYAVLRNLPGKTYHGRPVQIVVGYQNLPELQEKIKAHSFRVLKSECLDLPPKIYAPLRYFQITDLQRKHYDDFVEDVVTEFKGRRISSLLAMTRLMRLHQIVCGFLPHEDPKVAGVAINEGINPRITALIDVIEESNEKTIIYANYRFSLIEIWKALRAGYSEESIVIYAGEQDGKKQSQDSRADAKRRFQDLTSKVRFILGQNEALAYGHDLTSAHGVIYFSNDYKLETRQQSEDRPHRIGLHNPVLYTDIAAEGTVDVKIINSLIDKRDIASMITGDELTSWIIP